MSYLILDPAGEYPAAILEFLGSTGRRAIAVFTSEEKLAIWRSAFESRLAHCVADEYLLPEHPGLEALAAGIRADHPDRLEGIIPWDEMVTELGAALGEHLGLDWNSRTVMHRFRNKFAMKNRLREVGGIRVNASGVVGDEAEALAFAARVGSWPIVVKPTEGAGTRAVFLTYSIQELLERCRQVAGAGEGEVLLEEYVGGVEHVVNGIVDARGDLLVTDVWRYDKREFFGVPNLYWQTYKLGSYEPDFWPAAEYAGKVVEALGLRRAPIHMEVKIDGRGPSLIEVGARFAGGRHPFLSSMLHGRSMFELAACHYLASFPADPGDVHYDRYDRTHVRIVSGVQDEPIPRISGLAGTELVERLPSFHGFAELKPPGAPLPRTTDLYTRSFVVYLVHPDPDQVEHDVALVRRHLRYF